MIQYVILIAKNFPIIVGAFATILFGYVFYLMTMKKTVN